VTVTPNSAETLPSYPLRDYRLTWDVYDETKLLTQGERSFSVLSSTETISSRVESGAIGQRLQLHLTLIRPTGEIAAEQTLDWNSSQQSRQLDNALFPAR
jgi:hypothetical protein